MRLPATLRSTALQITLIVLGGLAVYHATLRVPFYLDDYSSIRDNAAVYQWRGFEPLRRFEPNRVVTYLTFRWNYQLGGFDVGGYHVVNLLVHVAAAIALFGLVRGLRRTPRARASLGDDSESEALPFVAALIFVLHPLQTQAVTYIVQRLASLVALFYLTSLAAWVQARLATSAPVRVGWFALSMLAMGLAFLTKENSATLPVAIVLIEWLAFGAGTRRLAATAVGAAAALALFAVSVVIGRGANAGALDTLSRETPDLTRLGYLATQTTVVLHYLRLFFVPTGLRLDYDTPIRDGFGHVDVLAATAAHLAVLALAFVLRKKRPLISLAILFVYLAHSSESGLIPIRDPVFEHRTYLPNAGLALLVAWLLTVEAARVRALARLAPVVTVLLLIALGLTAWRRNELWRDPVAFWRSNAELEPAKPRPRALLGRVLLEAGKPAEAVAELERAIALRQGARADSDAPIDLVNLIWGLRLLGRHDEALAWADRASAMEMDDATRASLRINRGNVLYERREWAAAELEFREALALQPDQLAALGNLAGARAQQGDLVSAESLWAAVNKIDPQDLAVRINLAQVRAQLWLRRGEELRRGGNRAEALGATRQSLVQLELARELAPGDASLWASIADLRRRIAEMEAGP